MADRRARLAGAHERQPRRIGLGVWRRHHLDDIAALELGAQRQHLVVDLDRDALVAQVAVHRVGKVQRGGAARQRADMALGREHVDRIREQVDLDVLQEFLRIAGLALDIEQRLQPLVRLLLNIVGVVGLVLVHPVRSHAGLGDLVHVARADLELHRRAKRAHQRGVQRLVAVDLGDGDVVLELAGHGLVQPMQRAHRHVAVHLRFHHHAETIYVQHLRERQLLVVHLAVDAVERFLAPGQFGHDAGVGQPLLRGFQDTLDHLAAVAARGLDGFLQRGVAERRADLEGQLLQFAVDRVETETVRDRRIDLHRLQRDTAAFLRRHEVERAHVVRTVGQLHQDHAHVARHRQQHLAEALRLRLLAALEFELVQFGQAIDQFGDLGAEFLGQLALGDALVFHHVVQQRRHDGLHIQLPVRAQLGHRHRMGDVGLTTLAVLAQMGFVGKLEGLAHARQVGRLQVREFLHQPGDGDDLLARRHRRLRGRAEEVPV